MPYKLLSMHPVIHATLAITNIIIIISNRGKTMFAIDDEDGNYFSLDNFKTNWKVNEVE